jgi:hypothetical protein
MVLDIKEGEDRKGGADWEEEGTEREREMGRGCGVVGEGRRGGGGGGGWGGFCD